MGKPSVGGWLRALARGRGGRVAAFGVHGAGGRLSAWESYLWDLDPTDSSQYPHAEIEMVDGAPRVKVVPASANRDYSLLGKPALNTQSWARSPDLADAAFLSTNRFFKVSVEVR